MITVNCVTLPRVGVTTFTLQNQNLMRTNHSKAILYTLLLSACCSLTVFSGCKYEAEESTEHTKSKTTIETDVPPPDSVAAVVVIDSNKAIIDDVKDKVD